MLCEDCFGVRDIVVRGGKLWCAACFNDDPPLVNFDRAMLPRCECGESGECLYCGSCQECAGAEYTSSQRWICPTCATTISRATTAEIAPHFPNVITDTISGYLNPRIQAILLINRATEEVILPCRDCGYSIRTCRYISATRCDDCIDLYTDLTMFYVRKYIGLSRRGHGGIVAPDNKLVNLVFEYL